jgi:hypothetical protein
MASSPNTAATAFCMIALCFAASAQISPLADQTYPHSAEGLQSQIGGVIHAVSTNSTAGRAALDQLGIPNTSQWFAAHFDQRFLAQLSEEYSDALPKFQSHLSWVAVSFSKFADFGINVQPSESPSPLRDSGFESLLPRPKDTVDIENYRFTSSSSDPSHGPPSFVSSFVYLDGRFRYVGGTYPFWVEGLSALRGPMSLPPALIHGRTAQGIAFRKDQKGPGIDAIVQLRVSIGRGGRVDHVKVLSGDQDFVQDAEDYLKTANFGPLPDVPQLVNAKREWDMEVVFFAPKQ